MNMPVSWMQQVFPNECHFHSLAKLIDPVIPVRPHPTSFTTYGVPDDQLAQGSVVPRVDWISRNPNNF
jgi:hypothetical protein